MEYDLEMSGVNSVWAGLQILCDTGIDCCRIWTASWHASDINLGQRLTMQILRDWPHIESYRYSKGIVLDALIGFIVVLDCTTKVSIPQLCPLWTDASHRLEIKFRNNIKKTLFAPVKRMDFCSCSLFSRCHWPTSFFLQSKGKELYLAGFKSVHKSSPSSTPSSISPWNSSCFHQLVLRLCFEWRQKI